MNYGNVGQAQAKQRNPDRIQEYQDSMAAQAAKAQEAQGAMVGCNGAIAIAKSPIEVQLDEQRERLLHLREAVNEVTGKLLSVLNYDPRQQPEPCNPSTSNPVTCELEGFLISSNREIREQTERLFEIRRLICL